MRIIFMGTPDFAVASLRALLEAGEDVVAVVTGEDKPAGRGQKMHESAVKKYAVEHHIPVLQPNRLKSAAFLEDLASYAADLQVVVAFRMLPEAVWNMPPLGTINVHASLLPQYRGAAPINHAIMNGERESGVTTFLLQQEIDTGNILFSKRVNIDDADNAGVLHDKLMVAGAEVLLETIQALKTNSVTAKPQTEGDTTPLKIAPKIFKEDCAIDWNRSTEHVYNHIRGLSPYPTAFTKLHNKGLKIFEAEKAEKTDLAPGQYITDGKTFVQYATTDGSLLLKVLQLEGKKKMHVDEFLRGYRFE